MMIIQIKDHKHTLLDLQRFFFFFDLHPERKRESHETWNIKLKLKTKITMKQAMKNSLKLSRPATLEWNCSDYHLMINGSKCSSNEWSNPENPLQTTRLIIRIKQTFNIRINHSKIIIIFSHDHSMHDACCR